MDVTTSSPCSTTDVTLGQLVERRPELARTLDRLGLDYCCGGHRSLAAACAEQGLDVDEVRRELAAVDEEAAPTWSTMGITQLVDHIEATHHALLWAELPRLSALLEKIENVHGERHPELARIRERYEQLRNELEPHLREEEQTVFPLVRCLAVSDDRERRTLDDRVGALRDDHEAAGALLAELRQLTGGYVPPADGCASYQAAFRGLEELEADVHLHVHKENNVLFPMVEQTVAAAVGTT